MCPRCGNDDTSWLCDGCTETIVQQIDCLELCNRCFVRNWSNTEPKICTNGHEWYWKTSGPNNISLRRYTKKHTLKECLEKSLDDGLMCANCSRYSFMFHNDIHYVLMVTPKPKLIKNANFTC